MKTEKAVLGILALLAALAVQVQAQSVITNGLLTYYPFNGNALDASGNGNNGTVQNATLTTNRFGTQNSAYYFNGSDASVIIPLDAFTNMASGTITAWVDLNSNNQGAFFAKQHDGANSYATFLVGGNNDGSGLASATPGIVYFSSENSSAIVASAKPLPTNAWCQIAVTFSPTNCSIYFNGVLSGSASGNFSIPDDAATLTTIGAWENGTETSFVDVLLGAISDFRIYKTALSPNAIAQLFALESTPPSPPTLTAQPQSVTVYDGGQASFSVTAAGSPPLSYQWQFNGTNLSGANPASYTVFGAAVTNTGIYTVVVSNDGGSVTSSNAVLTVIVPPAIITQPASQTVGAGGNVTFNVSAIGTPPLQYQWAFDGGSLTGDTNASLTLTNVQSGQGGNYSVTVLTTDGDLASSSAVLTVILPPGITAQPVNQTVTNGGTVSFEVEVTGADWSYQWLFNGLPLVTSNIITTVVGNQALGGVYLGDRGPATNAGLHYAASVAVDGAGNLYVADTFNFVIRKVNANGIITTVAGNRSLGGGFSGDGGAATNAALNYPDGVAVDGGGNLYIADSHNNVIRKVDVNGIIRTVAGNYSLGGGFSGDGGAATNATLNYPLGVAVDGGGNLFIAEAWNNVIRKVDANGMITTVAGWPSLGGGYSGDGGVATNAGLSSPSGILADGMGNLFIADSGNNVIRRVDVGGTITTVAGKKSLGGGYSGDGGAATNAAINNPNGLAEDRSRNLYFSEYGNNVIRKVDAVGVITTFAGKQSRGGGYSGDGGAAINAALDNPIGLTLDGWGNLLIGDAHNNVVRKVVLPDASLSSNNVTLTLTDVQTAMAGNYQVIISNLAGIVTSSNAVLTVIIPPATATATATLVDGFVVGVSLTYEGSGYTNAPLVRLIGGGGSGAQAVATVSNGVVTGLTITDAGSGYTNGPLVVIAPPFLPHPTLDIAAMSLLSFSNLTVGASYQLQQFSAGSWTNPPVSFTASSTLYTQMFAGVVGSGNYRLALKPVATPAYATPEVVGGFVVEAKVTSGGFGYVTNPAVAIIAVNGAGSGATAVASIGGGVVTSINITDAGIGYTNPPVIKIAPPPTGVVVPPTVQPVMRLDASNLTPYNNYQIQFTPALNGTWENWAAGLFSTTTASSTQYLFITNNTGFFQLQYVH